MKKKSLTLLELIVAMILVGFLIFSIVGVSIFFINRVALSIERTNLESQISYAFEDMRIRLISASRVLTPLPYQGGSRSDFSFVGENNIFNITPDNLADNVNYTYRIDNQGRLVLERTGSPTVGSPLEPQITVLLENRYPAPIGQAPITLSFNYTPGDEPNFMTVTLTVRTKKICEAMGIGEGQNCPGITRIEGIKLWFCDVVQ